MPSTSDKQRRFMGADLARKRAGKKTQTGMSEQQLSEFAGSVQPHGSLEDITYMEEAAECDMVSDEFTHPLHKGFSWKGEKTGLESDGGITWGALDYPEKDGEAFNKHKQSANRDIGQSVHYGAPVDYFGPDTDYRAEELDVHQYGVDWEPYPFRDYFKTEDDQRERGFRLMEQDEYNETRTPGTIEGDQRTSMAYGARGANSMQKVREVRDRRNFSDQQEFARAVTKKKDEYAVDVSGIDTKKGSKIR